MVRFDRADIRFLIVCALILAGSAVVGVRYFSSAFPEASIEFRVDRNEAKQRAAALLGSRGIEVPAGHLSSVRFEQDGEASIFLERSLGLERANVLMERSVLVWYWRVRWFKPLEREELRVDVAPGGEIVAFAHVLPEEMPVPGGSREQMRAAAQALFRQLGIDPNDIVAVSESERKLPSRVETTMVWEARTLRPAGAPYRYTVTFQGNRLSAFSRSLDVPDQWLRDYTDLRAKNDAAASIDTLLMLVTGVAAMVVFILRLRRGDIPLRFVLGVGLVGAVLVLFDAANSFPSTIASYDTRDSWGAFLSRELVLSFLRAIAMGVSLLVMTGAGEPLYRERLPQHLALPLLFNRRALRSRRVFLGFVLGYTLVGAFFAYQVIFYLTAARFGAWSPADIPYSEILNSAIPWAAVLLMGFFPAVSEEMLSRAFSIPFFEKILRSKSFAIVLAGFIWGFGHAGYPNQPFFIRGLEVGIVGVVAGLLMFRFGLLPLLVWHYTVDALYTSLLLFRSGNAYYIATAAAASLLFALPLIVALVGYLRRGGFEPDEPLENAALGSVPPPPPAPERTFAPVPPPARVTPLRLSLLAAALAIATAAIASIPQPLRSLEQLRVTREQATEIATRFMTALNLRHGRYTVAVIDPGFRTWNTGSTREDGGAPGWFDRVSLDRLVLSLDGDLARVTALLREHVRGVVWVVRTFTPRQKEEIFVDIDPRTHSVTGFHRYVDERAPGPSLDVDAARSIATQSLPLAGLRASDFVEKEALHFRQPARSDWLFHLEAREPLAGDVKQRVSVRVAGDRVTQISPTVWLPEATRRNADEQRASSILLSVLSLAGLVSIGGLAVAGFVLAARHNGFRWRRAARWTLRLAPLPALAVALQWNGVLAQYQTSIAWETWLVQAAASLLARTGFQLAAIFLAITAIDSVLPGAVCAARSSREYGRSGLVAALTAISLLAACSAALGGVPLWFPDAAIVDGVPVPSLAAVVLPSFVAIWQAVIAALLGSAAVALIAAWRRDATPRLSWRADVVILVSIVLALLDTSARGAEVPLMLALSVTSGVIIYSVCRFLLGAELLGYPLTFGLLVLGRNAAELLGHEGIASLRLHGLVLIAAGAAVVVTAAFTGSRYKPESAGSAG